MILTIVKQTVFHEARIPQDETQVTTHGLFSSSLGTKQYINVPRMRNGCADSGLAAETIGTARITFQFALRARSLAEWLGLCVIGR